MNSWNKTILFVTCITNEDLYQLCLKYIQKLRIPLLFNIEFLSLKNVNSMASGYNQALQHNAKYKIYLHQDTFITEENFLIYLVDLKNLIY
ncbi:glycosyltransferase [Bacillus cereus group sp. N6]|uniref:glycosyltransferase n=1 Tax=Bacillus cereus group sp. N6 TaxID=2794583 RepID=UPI0031F6ED8D